MSGKRDNERACVVDTRAGSSCDDQGSDVPLESVHARNRVQGMALRKVQLKELKAKIRTLRGTAQRWVLGGESRRLMTAWHGWYRMQRPRSLGFGQGSTGDAV